MEVYTYRRWPDYAEQELPDIGPSDLGYPSAEPDSTQAWAPFEQASSYWRLYGRYMNEFPLLRDRSLPSTAMLLKAVVQ